MQNAYTRAKVESGRTYNKDIDNDQNKLVLVRSLSRFHKVPDICDDMAGVYDLGGRVPDGALHPNDMCKITTKFRDDVGEKIRKLSGQSESTKHGIARLI